MRKCAYAVNCNRSFLFLPWCWVVYRVLMMCVRVYNRLKHNNTNRFRSDNINWRRPNIDIKLKNYFSRLWNAAHHSICCVLAKQKIKLKIQEMQKKTNEWVAVDMHWTQRANPKTKRKRLMQKWIRNTLKICEHCTCIWSWITAERQRQLFCCLIMCSGCLHLL